MERQESEDILKTHDFVFAPLDATIIFTVAENGFVAHFSHIGSGAALAFKDQWYTFKTKEEVKQWIVNELPKLLYLEPE